MENEKVMQTTENTNNVEFAISTNVDNLVFETFDDARGTELRHTTTTDTNTLFNAINGASKKVSSVIGKVLEIVDIVITSADVPSIIGDENSPRISKPCVHFFTKDGQHYASVSNGISRSTKNLLNCGITPTEDTPLKIVFTEIDTKRGKAHSFDLAK